MDLMYTKIKDPFALIPNDAGWIPFDQIKVGNLWRWAQKDVDENQSPLRRPRGMKTTK